MPFFEKWQKWYGNAPEARQFLYTFINGRIFVSGAIDNIRYFC